MSRTAAVVVIAALLGLPRGARGQASTDTWSGTWARGEVTGNLILEQTGSTVTGHYTWNDGTGTVSGTVSGATFTGSFNETHYQGSFTLTLAGTGFTGSYTGTNKDTDGSIDGPFTGTCTAGPCLANSGGSPGLATVASPGAFDTPTTIEGLAADLAVATASPPLGDASAVTATVEGLSPADVAAIGRYTARAYCVLKVTRAVVQGARSHKDLFDAAKQNADAYERFMEAVGANVLLDFAQCLAIADAIVDQELAGGGATVRPAAGPVARAAPSTTCPITPTRIVLQHSHGQIRPRRLRIAPVKGLSMSCTFDGGVWTLHVASRSGKPLRKLIGPQLIIGVARSKNDPPGGALTFTYHQG